MKHFFKFFSMTMLVFATCVSFASCSKDDDGPKDTALYNYSVVWELVDKGEMTTAQAQNMVASLTEDFEGAIRGKNISDAKDLFVELLEQLVYEVRQEQEDGSMYYKVTLRAKLVRDDNEQVVATKTLYIENTTCTLRLPRKITANTNI